MAYSAESIFVTYVEADYDLLKIWGQQDRTCATYIEKQLLLLIPEFNKTAGPDPSSICKGMLCFAKYADDNYYRARIMSKVQCNSVDVLFVDYGNRDYIDLNNIRILDGQVGSVLSKIVAQADEFYLGRVLAPSGGWTAQILDDIRRDLCYEEFKYTTVRQFNKEKLIQIFVHNNDYKNVLLSKKIAREISLDYQQLYVLNVKSQLFNLKANNNTDQFPNSNMFVSDQLQKNINQHFEQFGRNNKYQISEGSQPVISKLQLQQRNVLCTIPSSNQLQKDLPSMGTLKNNPKQIYDQNVISNFNPIQTVVQPAQQVNVRNSTQENPALNPINNYVIEALANQLKQHFLKNSVNTNSETSPSCYITQMLQIGTTHSVYVTHIDDGPWSFSVQLVSNENELNQLMVDLSELNLTPVKLPLVLGYPCIARSKEYDNLCRGVVVNISHNAVKVFYVDFGNTEDLPLSSVYELPSSFFQTKVLSQKFALSGLQQVKSTEEIKKAFVEIVENELLVLQVTNLEGENLPTCDLYLKGQNIKRILNDAVRSINNWSTETLPKKGEITNVVVTWVESPQKFFVQLKKNESDLESLKTELRDWGTKGLMFRFEELEPGLSCCCCFSDDKEWYRAVITSVNPQHSVTVFYVDFGNVETVNLNMIRKIESTGLIKQLPTQAIQCCLHGYETGTSDESTTNFLKELILDNELSMKVMQTAKNRVIVKLFKDDSDISLALLQRLKPPQSCLSDSLEKSVKQGDENSQHNMEFKKEIRSRSNESYGSAKYEYGTVREFRRNFEKKEMSNWRGTRFNITSSFHDSGNKTNDFDIKKDFRKEKQEKYFFVRKKNNAFNFEKNSEKSWRNYNENEENKIASNKTISIERNNIKYDTDSFENNMTFNNKQDKKWEKESKDRKIKYHTVINHSVKPENIIPPGTKLKEREIRLGSTEEVIITYFLNPNEIYIQFLSKEAEFRKMMEDIQNYYYNKCSIDHGVKKGDLVIVKFKEDEVLYRAEVIEVAPLIVRYLDYGNEELTEKERLWPMDKKYLELEVQSVKCSLANLKPKDNNSWDFSSAEVDKIFDHDKYFCTFLHQKENGYEVDLKIFESGEDVRDKLISLGFATSVNIINENQIDFTLMYGETFTIYISHIVNVSEFYIQIDPNTLQVIEEEIEKYIEYEKCVSFDKNFSLNEGELCLVRNEKNRWFRAKLIYKTENLIFVQFIDYGNSLEVTKDKIKFIPNHLKQYEPQALESSLFSLSNEFNVQINEAFRNCIYNTFKAFVHKAIGNRLYLTLFNSNGDKIEFLDNLNEAPFKIFPITSAPVIKQRIAVSIAFIVSPKEIYIHLMNDISSLREFNSKINDFYSDEAFNFEMDQSDDIYKICAAKSTTDNCWYRAKLLNMINDNAIVYYIDYGNTEQVPKENIRKLDLSFYYHYAFAKKVTLNLKYVEEEEFTISQEINNLITDKECLSYFVKREDITYIELFVDGVAISDLLMSDKRKKLYDDLFKNISSVNSEMIKISSESSLINSVMKEVPEKVFISHVSSPNDFWILDENRSDEIDTFQNSLQNICRNAKIKTDIDVGDIIGGLYIDDLWYRVEVKNMNNNILLVQLIDFGNSFEIDLEHKVVVELPEDILKVPAFVSPCSLKGKWKQDTSSRFENIVTEYQDPFVLIELKSGHPRIVDLIGNGISITERLIEEGFFEGPEQTLCNENDFIYIVHINSPNDFYVQRDCDEIILNEISSKLLNAETFEDVKIPKENEMYCLKFKEDDLWYRVKVLKTNGDDVEVHFIDYGNYDMVKSAELKLLPVTLQNIPQLALNCCLTYGNSHDTWSEQACQKFMEYLNTPKLKMEVVLQGVQKSVVKLFNEIGQNLTEELEALCEEDHRFEVYVTYVNSPSDFYIVEANNKNFDYISMKLLESDTFEELNDIRVGIYCASKSVTGVWYRAKILKVWECYYETFLIDFGCICKSNCLKKLPLEIESIEPLAKNCALNFSVKNIPESIKEEFINLTENGNTLFRAMIIKKGNRDIISLMLEGKKLEEVLLYTISENSEIYNICLDNENQNFESVNNDDKKSCSIEAINSGEDYEQASMEADIWVTNPFGNETDEEKRYKFSMIIGDNIEGFKSDDEKGILDNNSINSNMMNIPDNDLLEDCAENTNDIKLEESFHSEGSTVDSVHVSNANTEETLLSEPHREEKFSSKNSDPVLKEDCQQTEDNATDEKINIQKDNDENKISDESDSYKGKDDSFVNMNKTEASELACETKVQIKNGSESFNGLKRKEERIIPGCASRGDLPPDSEENETMSTRLSRSEKIVSGSVGRRISLEQVSNKPEEISIIEVKNSSSSAPCTPLTARRKENV